MKLCRHTPVGTPSPTQEGFEGQKSASVPVPDAGIFLLLRVGPGPKISQGVVPWVGIVEMVISSSVEGVGEPLQVAVLVKRPLELA